MPGAVGRAVFAVLVHRVLCPPLTARQIIVRDHLTLPIAAPIASLTQARGSALLLRLANSPAFTLVGLGFSTITRVRRVGVRTYDVLHAALSQSLLRSRPRMCPAGFNIMATPSLS